MRTPFGFGGSIAQAHFVNRTEELEMLSRNFAASQNTVLISPRRWGKSSLVNRAVAQASESDFNLRFVRLDLLAVRTEAQFLAAYLQATLQGLGGTVEKSLALLREAAATLLPKVTFSAGPDAQMRIGFDWRSEAPDRAEVLELPHKLARKHGWRVVVAIDEFQAIAELSDANKFDAVLRSHWQHHQLVCYCLYGSKRHMMLNLFGSYGSPFYHFADAHVLDKISRHHWVAYIVDRFRRFHKSISEPNAELLALLVVDHSHYVQQLAQVAFGLTTQTCTEEVVRSAYDQLLYQVEPFFSQQLMPLSKTQLGFLRAVIDGEQSFSSQDVLRRYEIGSSANAYKQKRVLQEKELIHQTRDGTFELVDPLMQEWLTRRWGFEVR